MQCDTPHCVYGVQEDFDFGWAKRFNAAIEVVRARRSVDPLRVNRNAGFSPLRDIHTPSENICKDRQFASREYSTKVDLRTGQN
jgi:hypothetical protein